MFQLDQAYFQTYNQQLQGSNLLEKIDEDTIYNNYQGHLAVDAALPFKGFTSENKEMFQRLKFRSINSRIPAFGGAAPEIIQPQQLKTIDAKPFGALKELMEKRILMIDKKFKELQIQQKNI